MSESQNPSPAGPEQIAARLFLDGTWRNARSRVVWDQAIRALAAADGTVISDEDLQQAVDDYRYRERLSTPEDTQRWLDESGLTLDHLVEYCRTLLQEEGLLAATPRTGIDNWFTDHRADYDAVLISAVTVASEPEGWLARAAAEAEGESFHAVAWVRSQTDRTVPPGGALGWKFRCDLPADVGDALFAEADSALVGPIRAGGSFCLYRVWGRREAALTPAVASRCAMDRLAGRVASWISASGRSG